MKRHSWCAALGFVSALAGVAAAARERRQAPRRAGPPPGRAGRRGVRQRRRHRGSEGAAVSERRPGRVADGAAVRPGHDQATGGGRGSAGVDLLPHVSGDGDNGVSVERGDARARAADRRSRLAEDDEAVRPDGGHDHRRRDRAHRDLEREPAAGSWRPFRLTGARIDARAGGCRIRLKGDYRDVP